MKNLVKKKIFPIALASLLFLSAPAYAAEIIALTDANQTITVNAVPDTATGVVTVSGKISAGGATDFTLVILKPDVNLQAITNDNFLTKVDFITTGTTATDGTFSVKCLPVNEWSGSEQQVIVAANGLEFGVFAYVTETIEELILDTIKNATADDIGDMLSGEMLIDGKALHSYLGINLTDYNAIINKDIVHSGIAGKTFADVKALSESLINAIQNQKLIENTDKANAEFLNNIKTASDEEMDALLKENADRFSLTLDKEYGYTYLKGLYDDGVKEALEDVYADIRKISSLSEVKDVLDNAVILSAVNMADWQTLDEVLEVYQTELGIDDMDDFDDLSDSKKADLLREMAKSDFDSLPDINREFTDLIEEYSQPKKSGGGGGGSSTSSSGNITLPLVPNNEIQSVTFTDIDTVSWAVPSINYLSEKKIISGYPDGSFRPNEPVRREEFAKMLVLALGLYDGSSTCEFSDVLEDSWYYKYVASGFHADLIKGMGETFGVGMYITREDAATMIYRAALMINKALGEGKDFADNDEISEYAKEGVKALGGTIITGDENGKFNPKNITTRAQTAKMIYQLLQ